MELFRMEKRLSLAGIFSFYKKRYYELLDTDVIKFGLSERTYVIMLDKEVKLRNQNYDKQN